MGYIQGDGRDQGTLFPVMLDDLLPLDHMCRVVDAFVEQLDMQKLGFERAEPADTENALVIAHEVVLDAADSRSLETYGKGREGCSRTGQFNVVADAGYSNAEQAANCEANGIFPCVPATRTRILMGMEPSIRLTNFAMRQTRTQTVVLAMRRSEEEAIHTKDKSSCSLPVRTPKLS